MTKTAHGLQHVKNILLVASGKGGVGKSMVAANLAIALSREGQLTGLLDADLYGPSVPINFGLTEHNLIVDQKNEQEIFEPAYRFGVKIMSLGFMMKEKQAVIWRGPMASSALTQLLEQTNWGPLDTLVIDMPPGTGDVAITLCQKLPQARAIVVITPQHMALADARKAGHMFHSGGINIPILGVVENMSWFIPENHPNEKYHLFGEGGGQALANELQAPLLCQIPLVADVGALSDKGKSIFSSTNPILMNTFESLARSISREEIPV